MKKTWIKIKRGLNDPKHREAMGMAIWLYMHILDRVDWDSGIVYDWRDADEADDMGMNHRTVRAWRKKLEDEGYIATTQKQYSLEIKVYNWTSPRAYDGEVINEKKQGDTETAPETSQGDTQGDTQGDSENVTPTFSSQFTDHNSANAENSPDDQEATDTFLSELRARKKPASNQERQPVSVMGIDWAIADKRPVTNEDIATSQGDTITARLAGWYEVPGITDEIITVSRTVAELWSMMPPAKPEGRGKGGKNDFFYAWKAGAETLLSLGGVGDVVQALKDIRAEYTGGYSVTGPGSLKNQVYAKLNAQKRPDRKIEYYQAPERKRTPRKRED